MDALSRHMPRLRWQLMQCRQRLGFWGLLALGMMAAALLIDVAVIRPALIWCDQRSQAQVSQADAELRNTLARDTEAADLKWLMGSKRGRRVVWRLLDTAGVFRLSFNTNALQMAFNEGNRNYGNRTLAQLQAVCPDLYALMAKEHAHDQRDIDDGS